MTGGGFIRMWTSLLIIIIFKLRRGSCLGCYLESGWLKRNNYIKCTYLVRIMGGQKSIPTFVDVCGEGVNRLRDLRQNSSHWIKEGGFEGMGEALPSNMSKRLASSMSLSDDIPYKQSGS